ncbi:hypothetical protein FA95DRAFT_1581680 [Auriscalpium vulgare]|uniref:Uncharacterized protein n=1 Tax=Auriscalpium vulgare TaxID=40419 RepID=A0ACB8RZN2_9AGAM|nr:hypothetical protein FA95DRAFT_1581680 [Auriscalpium vulgare]
MAPIAHLGWLWLYASVSLAAVTFSSPNRNTRSLEQLKYSRAHSLGDHYAFDARDGWHAVNVSNLPYKYGPAAHAGRSKRDKKAASKSIGDSIGGAVKNAVKGLKGIGRPEDVTITWYTGHDLQNPSCWTDSDWAPTDKSFACALTLDGWASKPQCFKFLELCHGTKKCVFVRVVDSCAGCKKDSRHVDLTRAAFGQLADFDDGILTVQMRMATEPESWFEELWGPKA